MTMTLPDPGPPNPQFERPADRTRLDRTVAALTERGFAARVADSGEHARELLFDIIPDGAEVHAALSETLRELGITDEIEKSGRYRSIRAQLSTLDRETQRREMQQL